MLMTTNNELADLLRKAADALQAQDAPKYCGFCGLDKSDPDGCWCGQRVPVEPAPKRMMFQPSDDYPEAMPHKEDENCVEHGCEPAPTKATRNSDTLGD